MSAFRANREPYGNFATGSVNVVSLATNIHKSVGVLLRDKGADNEINPSFYGRPRLSEKLQLWLRDPPTGPFLDEFSC